MKVSELIKWLETQDQEAVVEVIKHTSGSGYYDQGGWCHAKVLNVEPSFVATHDSSHYGELYEYTPAMIYLGCHIGATLRLGVKE